MFVVRPGVLLDLLGAGDPEFAAALREIAADPGPPRGGVADAAQDRARPRGRRAGRRRRAGWRPCRPGSAGTTSATSTRSPTLLGGEGTTVLGDAELVEAIDATGLVVPAGGRLVAVVGLDDVVVVDTPDAVLVTTRARAQQVKQVVDALKARRSRPTSHSRSGSGESV